MITNIQGLRFIAALAVCILHVGVIQGQKEVFASGRNGVDLFFVISGFIMVVSSQSLFGKEGAPGQFIYRRLVRIVPLYWIATGVYVAFICYNWWMTAADVQRTIAGLFFIPLLSPAFIPFLPVGWTLNFEALFYLLFAGAIRFRQAVAISIVTAAICVIAMIGVLYFPGAPENGFAAYVFQSIMLEFVWGMLAGALYVRGWKAQPIIAGILVALGAYAMLYPISLPPILNRLEFMVGLPCLMIVFGAACLPQVSGRTGWIVGKLGDASYALYLFHWILFMAARDWPPIALLASAVALSLAVRAAVEAPLLIWLRRKTEPARDHDPCEPRLAAVRYR
jgi:peptidoglycan/LPS O-acetylase OafA/YrhL